MRDKFKKSKKNSADYGLVPASRAVRRRLVIAARGPEYSGKTYFSLTATGPIAYFDFDVGGEGVLNNFPDKKIDQKLIQVPRGSIVEKVDKMIIQAEPVWEDYSEAYYYAIESNKYGTVVIDKEADQYRLARLAKLGTLNNDDLYRFQYGRVNKLVRDMVRAALHSNTNLILIQGRTPEFDKSGKEKKGKWKGDGFKEIDSLVQVTLEFDRDGDERWFTVDKCRPNKELHGEKFEGDMMDFTLFASMVTGTDQEEWE